jgi:hypothetical protein
MLCRDEAQAYGAAKPVLTGVCRCRTAEQLPLLPVIALALLPKCPLCLGVWLGLIGAAGAGSWLKAAWGTPLNLVLLTLTVGTLVQRARRSGRVLPLLLSLPGATAVMAEKYLTEPPLLWAGFGLLIAAVVWNSFENAGRKSRKSTEPSRD